MRYDRSRTARCRRGATLVELLVVLLVLGLVLSVVTLSMPEASGRTDHSVRAQLEGDALASGRPRSALLGDSSTPTLTTAYPDGFVVTDSLVGLGLTPEPTR